MEVEIQEYSQIGNAAKEVYHYIYFKKVFKKVLQRLL